MKGPEWEGQSHGHGDLFIILCLCYACLYCLSWGVFWGFLSPSVCMGWGEAGAGVQAKLGHPLLDLSSPAPVT